MAVTMLAQAGLVKRVGCPDHAGRLVFELLGHLPDNKVSGSACEGIASRPIYHDAAIESDVTLSVVPRIRAR